MARMQTTPRFPLGTTVLKHFPGYAEPFVGVVDKFLLASGFYHVSYEDGDSEEMTEEDVETHAHERTVRRKKKKKTTSSSAAERPTPKSKTLLRARSGKRLQKTEDESMTDESMADDEEDEEAEDEDEEEEEEEEEADEEEEELVGAAAAAATDASSITKLLGQRVCKKQTQADGADVVVGGTVSTYFPATKMYRVVYNNGTTDDMTYREVVDSIPLGGAPASVSGKAKRKSLDGVSGSSAPVSSKKRKSGATSTLANNGTKPKASDENTNSENTRDHHAKKRAAAEQPPPQAAAVVADAGSAMELPAVDEDGFVWSRKTAYDMVRAVLYIVVSTTNRSTESLQALEQKELSAKHALTTFVATGGFVALEERLSLWCEKKETEQGVLAILKVLSVIPGVTRDVILSSRIGLTLSSIKKGRTAVGFDPVVQDMASWIIKKWKKDVVDGSEDGKTEKESVKAVKTGDKRAAASSASNGAFKPARPSIGESASASSKANGSVAASQKRSNSVSHLRNLMGVSHHSQRGGADLLGGALGGRPGARPLGAAHARRARRSTVLLDSIADRVNKNSAVERAEALSNERREASYPTTASRVTFGRIDTLEFEKEVEVSLLLIAPTVGGIRPFRPKNAPPTVPARDKQPQKSILRVKLALAEREANAAEAQAEQVRHREKSDSREELTVDSVTVSEISGGQAGQANERDSQVDVSNSVDGVDEREDDEGEDSLPVAPPSPPRKRDTSEDAENEEMDGLPPMPSDLLTVDSPSPPSSDGMRESLGENADSPRSEVDDTANAVDVEMEAVDEQVVAKYGARAPAPSPEVSPNSPSSPESGEILDDDSPAPPSPASPPSALASPPCSPPTPPPVLDIVQTPPKAGERVGSPLSGEAPHSDEAAAVAASDM